MFGQTFQDFEVILLDDASTDGSLDILNLYKDHPKVSHLIVNKVNSGSPFKQWKKGIELAKGEYIWIAESDDFCELVFLESVIQSFTKDIGLIYCQTKDVDEKGNVLLDRVNYTSDFQPNYWQSDFEMDGNVFIQKVFLIKNVIPNASAVVFKKTLAKPSFFTESLLQMKMCGDWFYWLQLTKSTKVKFVNSHFNYFRDHRSISRIHKNAKTKKRRLLEEAEIRRFAEQNYGLALNEMNGILYNKWFKLQSKLDLFSFQFYRIKLPSTSNFSLILKFIKFKLK